jgi:hypothetical protein
VALFCPGYRVGALLLETWLLGCKVAYSCCSVFRVFVGCVEAEAPEDSNGDDCQSYCFFHNAANFTLFG